MNHTKKKLILLSCVAVAGLAFQGCIGNKSEESLHITASLIEPDTVALAVIGSGPAGLSAAIYGGRGLVKTVVFQGNTPGGLLMQTTDVENWPGEISIKGPDLIGKLRKHAEKLGAQFIADSVTRVDFSTWPYRIYTEEGKTYKALSLVIATGATPLMLNIGEGAYMGRGVGTCAVCDAAFYKDEDVIVVGGGDSALEEALQLSQYAKTITVVVRRDRMRASGAMQERVKNYPSIQILFNTEVKKVLGDNNHVTGVELYNNKTKQTTTKAVSGIFLAIGHKPNSKIFGDDIINKVVDNFSVLGYPMPKEGMARSAALWVARKYMAGSFLETNDYGYIKTIGRTQATNIPGVFVAGEVEDGRYRQAIAEAGKGASAALDALAFLTEHGLTPALSAEFNKKMVITQEDERQPLEAITSLSHLDQVVKEGPSVVVLDFYTKPCRHCKIIQPMVEAVAAKFKDNVTFYKVDADDAMDVTQKFIVQKVPYFIILKDGKLAGRLMGHQDGESISKTLLTDFIEQYVGSEEKAEK